MQFNTPQDVQVALKRAETKYFRRMAKYDWFDAKINTYKPSMRLLKSRGVFKSSKNDRNVFDPIRMTAYSYGWWRFVERIGGKVVFNNCSYSATTTQHQHKVSNLMRELGIKVDVEIEVPKGLQNLDSGVALYERRIQDLVALIQNPRSRKETNKSRVKLVREYQAQIEVLNGLIVARGEE